MSNTIEQSVRDDDATLCQNTTTTCLVNPTASRISLRTDFRNGGLAADRHSGSARLVRRPVQLLPEAPLMASRSWSSAISCQSVAVSLRQSGLRAATSTLQRRYFMDSPSCCCCGYSILTRSHIASHRPPSPHPQIRLTQFGLRPNDDRNNLRDDTVSLLRPREGSGVL